MSERIPKFNELIKKEVGLLLLKEVEFPKDCLVTIVRVHTAGDLKHARIFLSVLPFAFGEQVLKIATKKAGAIQFLLNKKLSCRPLPRIDFALDQTEEKAAGIEELLDKIKKTG